MAIAPECRTGCKYLDACALHYEAEQIKALSEGKAMTQALWCDQHDGPFSAKDRKQQTLTRQGIDEETGEVVTEQFTMCGKCAASFQVGRQPVALPPVERPDYSKIAALEDELGME